ncbi:MCE family protein [Thalassotalea sp. M1531]|uniref:MCE family protein n=1 Tax=Thalassotalea algicola TaxID=2716224 RepID=A0A7Y0L9W6_9GAMM|nr:MlaD family protein [Thalassotalea algicola]NMP30645.1 MCE family protein [Thalassotalea algicola]
MNNNTPDEGSMVKVVKREGISAVWLVPFIALLFGGWLLIKAVAERGVFITVQFDNANGIVVGKTEVRYKGLTVGKVVDIEVSEDLQKVLVEIEMIAESEAAITDKTQFWYVTADISFAGVKGLDTLLSGSYINMKPDVTGLGNSQREFVALDEEPPLDESVEGLHLVLTTNKLGSIAKDSPITYKQIKVGYVAGYQYDEQLSLVKVNVFIEPEHAHLVKENSRFWNASGFSVTGSITSGINIQTESLASIVTGGIAFDTDEQAIEKPVAKNHMTYELHSNFQEAEMGHTITLDLAWDADIDIGAPIVYQGITLGKLESFTDIDPETRKIQAQAKINPRVRRYLTTETQFFLINPQLDLGGVTNMHRMLTGSQIGVRPSGEGEISSRFKVFNQKPAYKYKEPGLHIVLESSGVYSLNAGDGIYYKQQAVGSVQAIENTGPNQFLVHIFIKPQYQNYVSKDSRFWNASGFRFTGGLQGFELQAQSLQSIIKGGIAFDKGNKQVEQKPMNGDRFILHANKDMAKERLPFELAVANAKDIKRGTRIMHRGELIGSVHHIERREGKAYMTAGLLPQHEYVLREGSLFWLVKADISLSGLTDTDALFGGNYIGVNAGEGQIKRHFVAHLTPPKKPVSHRGLQLRINAESASVVNSGSPISYRGITVGQVDNIGIEASGAKVAINITIDEEYRHFITPYSRFYNASGLTISGGLSNFVVKTESADAMLTGGISFYNPEQTEGDLNVAEGDTYSLFDNLQHAQSAGEVVSIYFNEISGLKSNMKIKFKGQDIGFIERVIFDTKGYGATVVAYLSDSGQKFAVTNTKFWLEQSEVGLVGNKNIGAILSGGFVNVIPGSGGKQREFVAEDIAPVVERLPYGLNIKLVADRLGSVRVGNPVLYRQVPVGKVIGVGLSNSADKVDIYINIAQRYAKLVTSNSEFWNTSGVTIDAGLLSGVKIDSESIETLIAGGISFATPEREGADSMTAVENGHTFTLYPEFKDKWYDWAPKIPIGAQ